MDNFKEKLKMFLCKHKWKVIAVAMDGTSVRGECEKCHATAKGKIVWGRSNE